MCLYVSLASQCQGQHEYYTALGHKDQLVCGVEPEKFYSQLSASGKEKKLKLNQLSVLSFSPFLFNQTSTNEIMVVQPTTTFLYWSKSKASTPN